jgi:hypothetical protein
MPITFRIAMNYDFPRCGRGLEFRSLQKKKNSVWREFGKRVTGDLNASIRHTFTQPFVF